MARRNRNQETKPSVVPLDQVGDRQPDPVLRIGTDDGIMDSVLEMHSRAVASPTAHLVTEESVAFVKLDFAVLSSPNLTHCDKLVYCSVLTFGGFSRIDPSENQIAERCNVSRRQVQLSISNLQKIGILIRTGRLFTFHDPATITQLSATIAPIAADKSATIALGEPENGAIIAQSSATLPKTAQPLRTKSATIAHSIDSIDSSIDRNIDNNSSAEKRGEGKKNASHSQTRKHGTGDQINIGAQLLGAQVLVSDESSDGEQSRANRRTASNLPALPSKDPKAKPPVDIRHGQVAKLIQDAWSKKNDGLPCPWDGHVASVLARLLKSTPRWKIEHYERNVLNWMASETNHSELPKTLIPRLPSFSRGPLNKYGKPSATSTGTLEDDIAASAKEMGYA